MKPLRACQQGSVEKIRAAVEGLRVARMNLQDAGAVRAAEKVRRALKSAEGAFRHAVRVEYVSQQQEREEMDRTFNRGFAIGLVEGAPLLGPPRGLALLEALDFGRRGRDRGARRGAGGRVAAAKRRLEFLRSGDYFRIGVNLRRQRATL